jgi:hypothetical protein
LENGCRKPDPAVEYVQQHARLGDEVFGSCSFGFGYGFPPQFVDDDRLGFYSGRRPAFVVMEEIYDEQHRVYRTEAPAVCAHAQGLLAAYDLVYRNSEYRIYRRPRD